MGIFQAIILGFVQGIAEFLPISSSGHLVILHNMFGVNLDDPTLFTFDIVVHLGSLVAIILVFWADIFELIKNPFSKATGLLIVGTIPAVVAAVFFGDIIESYLRTGIWLVAAFTVTGFLLIYADRVSATAKTAKTEITYKDAIIVGCMQALALPPGISRSGTTITGALARGLDRATAAKFSFMLAIIAISGAGLREGARFFSGDIETAAIAIAPMVAGFITSLVVGYFSIKLLLELIKKCKLVYFSYYVWGLAALILLDLVVVNHFF